MSLFFILLLICIEIVPFFDREVLYLHRQPNFSDMNNRLVTLFTLLACCLTILGASTYTAKRDVLIHQLQSARTVPDKQKILIDLNDLGLSMNDYTYTHQLWNFGVQHKSQMALQTAGASLALKYINSNYPDTAIMWINNCRRYFSGKVGKTSIYYLQLMNDIRNFNNKDEVIKGLMADTLKISEYKRTNPYKAMVLLYKLAVVSIENTNAKSAPQVRSWDSYFKEGYEIAKRLPFDESYRFRQQFLAGLCSVSKQYAYELITLNDNYLQLPEIKSRPYFPHTSVIVAYGNLLFFVKDMTPAERDKQFAEFCRVTSAYPSDCPISYTYYFNYYAYNYYYNVGNYAQAATCCDKAIAEAKANKLDYISIIKLKVDALAASHQWEKAFSTYKEYTALNDSISSKDAEDKTLELQTKYDVDKLQYTNDLHRLWLIIAIAICLFLVITTALLIRHSNVVRAKNKALVKLIREYENPATERLATTETDKTPTTGESDKLLDIYQNLQNFLSNKDALRDPSIGRDDLVKHLGTNRTYLTDAIKKYGNGIPLSEFINRQRAKHARVMLDAGGEIPMKNICDECGFSSYSNFYRVFKAVYGVSPTDYRKYLDTPDTMPA